MRSDLDSSTLAIFGEEGVEKRWGNRMARRRETVIHTCSISERLVRIMFVAGVKGGLC